jgi:hypothetical protein
MRAAWDWGPVNAVQREHLPGGLIAMPRVRIGPALPDREALDVEIARLRDLDIAALRNRCFTRQSVIGSPGSLAAVSAVILGILAIVDECVAVHDKKP